MSNQRLELNKGIKIASIYIIIAGALGIIFSFIGPGPNYPEFEAKSLAFKLGSYTKEHLINILFVVSGIGILKKKNWARKMALTILVVGCIYSSNDFAWGLAGGPPPPPVRLISLGILILWNGLWFYLIYKNKPVSNEKMDQPPQENDSGNQPSANNLVQSSAFEKTQTTVTNIRKDGKTRLIRLIQAIGGFTMTLVVSHRAMSAGTALGNACLLIGIALSLWCLYHVFSPIIRIENGVIFMEKAFSTPVKLMMSDIQGIEKNPEYLDISIKDNVSLIIRNSMIHPKDWKKLEDALRN